MDGEPPIIAFEFEDAGTLYVYRVCPECGRFIKGGDAKVNMLGDVFLEGFICKKHGEVKPEYEWY